MFACRSECLAKGFPSKSRAYRVSPKLLNRTKETRETLRRTARLTGTGE
jgi:hypothetical protein